MKKIILLLSLCLVFSGCFKNYFSVKSISAITEEDWNKANEPGKKLILHTRDKNIELVDMKMDSENIEAAALPYFPLRQGYANPDPVRKNHSYNSKDATALFEQVHIYSQISLDEKSFRVSMQKKDVDKLCLYKPAKAATTLNHSGNVLLIGIAIGTILMCIAASSMSISIY